MVVKMVSSTLDTFGKKTYIYECTLCKTRMLENKCYKCKEVARL